MQPCTLNLAEYYTINTKPYMLSRVADSLFWMSRYMERADGILRMLKINYASSQDDLQEFSWMPVLSHFYLPGRRAGTISVIEASFPNGIAVHGHRRRKPKFGFEYCNPCPCKCTQCSGSYHQRSMAMPQRFLSRRARR